VKQIFCFFVFPPQTENTKKRTTHPGRQLQEETATARVQFALQKRKKGKKKINISFLLRF